MAVAAGSCHMHVPQGCAKQTAGHRASTGSPLFFCPARAARLPAAFPWPRRGGCQKVQLQGRKAWVCAAAATPGGLPATYEEAVVQARYALRSARDALQSSVSDLPPESLEEPPGEGELPLPLTRLLISIPVPPPGTEVGEALRMMDESDWPGGLQQRHRYLRPVVEGVLSGYGAEFIGLLEDDADGMGVWKTTADITAVGQVVNATFPGFLKLCQGQYGDRVTRRGHALLVFNAAWTEAKDLGQLWDRKLREDAEAVLDNGGWETIYYTKLVRTAYGINGYLHRAYPGPWRVYTRGDGGEGGAFATWLSGDEGDAGAGEPELVLETREKPGVAEIGEALTAARDARRGG